MDAVTLNVRLKRAIEVRPGSYFYIYLPSRWAKYNFLHSVTAMVYWYPPEDGPEAVREVTFLLSRASYNASFQEGQFIFLDGPYGQDPQLHKYQNVVLAAKGIGIAAILPLALDIGARRRRDDINRAELQKISYKLKEVIEQKGKSSGNELASILQKEKLLKKQKDEYEKKKLYRDTVKNVDLFWSLEDNSQMIWAQNEIRALQKLDPHHKLFVAWCGFPKPQSGYLPFKDDGYWKCIYSVSSQTFDKLLVHKIQEQRLRRPGNLAVIACGDVPFMANVRNGVIESIDDKNIEYKETEFQPISFGHNKLKGPSAGTLLRARTTSTKRNTMSEDDASLLRNSKDIEKEQQDLQSIPV
ncbi:hypothetical protein M441DRAFT_154578 [Trichoderma asperellum CBS 433.97]|uniref:FAD-binding FR-type domain-containing protein n=1 Tax=Trichoderma asperellum (strain ATCC 204424 / CBS 433.97 / NBRC 101777) TaxID=1042311 RepID=A0A2T3YQU0_TRIA4|nr:hypothetical protein M441DRAFT_154578 [Trichoderma asperellum CBS 433.97]PTB34940.1 hypothetical protein M441DRAFT_154578 [Trichoderma asperellum CBS 433.97]